MTKNSILDVTAVLDSPLMSATKKPDKNKNCAAFSSPNKNDGYSLQSEMLKADTSYTSNTCYLKPSACNLLILQS